MGWGSKNPPGTKPFRASGSGSAQVAFPVKLQLLQYMQRRNYGLSCRSTRQTPPSSRYRFSETGAGICSLLNQLSTLQALKLRNTAKDGLVSTCVISRVVLAQSDKEGGNMLYWTLVFLVIALIAGVLGFTGVAVAAAGLAKLLFFVFLVLFVLSLVTHLSRRGSGI